MNESPVKKLNFEPTGKENTTASFPDSDLKKPVSDVKPAPAEPPKVAPGIKDMEADEPLLQENPHRFVLFPIKFHEVWPIRVACRVKWLCCFNALLIFPFLVVIDLADVQKGRSFFLDC